MFHENIEKKEKDWQEKKNVFTFFYDVETYNHNETDKGDGKSVVDMVPYLLVSMLVCYKCSGEELRNEQCEKCGTKRQEIFHLDLNAENDTDKCPVDKFINYLFSFSKKHQKDEIIVAAHN